MSDTGLVNVTENEYYGNKWEKGVVDSGSRELLPIEWQQIQETLTDIDFIHFPHCFPCGGSQTPYILEYKDNRNSISYYTECSGREDVVKNRLVSLVDPDYVDMVVNYTGEVYKTVAPAYPGGEEACAAFIQNAIHYPPDALHDLVEYRARVEFVVEKDGSIQLSMFQLDDPLLESLRDRLKSLDLNNMTPLQAFDALRGMKDELGV